MRRTTGNLMLALANVVIVLMGIGLVALGDLGQVLGGVLFALFGLAGLSMVGADLCLPRRRPVLELGTAPSGAAALVFPYSRFTVLQSGIGTSVLVLWCAVSAGFAAIEGHRAGALVLGLVGLGLAVPLVPLLRGRIVAGGLYVTAVGLEFRHEGAGWSVPWDGIRGVVPRDHVYLSLHSDPDRHDATRIMWRRGPRGGRLLSVVPDRYIAGGPAAIAMVVARGVTQPEQRGTLAQAHVVRELNELLRDRVSTVVGDRRPSVP